MFRDFWHITTNLDQGLLNTLRLLFTKPEKVVHEYLQGLTRPYQNPFQFIFLMAGLSAFINIQLGLFDSQQEAFFSEVPLTSLSTQNKLNEQVKIFLHQYFAFFITSTAPFAAISSYWIFRKKHIYTFAEFLIMNLYLIGQTLFIQACLDFLTSLFIPYFPALLSFSLGYSTLIIIFYYTFFFYRFYQFKPFKAILLAIWHSVLMFILFGLFITIATVLLGIGIGLLS